MTMKKMLLLLASMAALIALAAPAAAQASNWYLEGEGPGGTDLKVGTPEKHYKDHFSGAVTYESTSGVYRLGPCDVSGTVDVWNEGGEARSEVSSFLHEYGEGHNCPIDFLGSSCTLVQIDTPVKPPWPMEMVEEPAELAIVNWNVRFFPTLSCAYTKHIELVFSQIFSYWNSETHCLEIANSYTHDLQGNPWMLRETELCGTSEKLVLY